MDKENERGDSGVKSGGIGKRGVIAAAVLIFSASPSVANAHYFLWHHSISSSCYYRHSLHAFGHRLPDGSIHSGYVPADTHFSSRAFGRRLPDGSIHSGLVDEEWYELPSGLKDLIPPYDMARYDVAKGYARYFFIPKTNLVNKIENYNKEGPSYEERVATRKARTEELKKEVQKRKQQEGLDEFTLFKGYFDSLNIPYHLAKMNSHNQTVVVRIDLPTYPNVIIEWRDDSLLKDMPSWFHTVYKRGRNDYLGQGKTIVEITETSSDKITLRLEEIVVRYQLQKNG